MIVVAYENRPEMLVGTKLLALSLARHCPDVSVRIVLDCPTDEFAQWSRRFPKLTVVPAPSDIGRGYDVKPALLLDLLAGGTDEAVWIDSDIVLSGDFRKRLGGVPSDAIVVAQERPFSPGPGTALRTKGWGLEVGRSLRRTVNSCFVRATPGHAPLLKQWQQMLTSPEYRDAQSKNVHVRAHHLKGDQDALGALLGSWEFSDVPVHFLAQGRDVAQCYQCDGYTVASRAFNVFRGVPPLIHCLGAKPWIRYEPPMPGLELSPYSRIAQDYAGDLGEESSWMYPRRPLYRLLDRAVAGNANLRDLPLALAQHVQRSTAKLLSAPGAAQRRLAPALGNRQAELSAREGL